MINLSLQAHERACEIKSDVSPSFSVTLLLFLAVWWDKVRKLFTDEFSCLLTTTNWDDIFSLAFEGKGSLILSSVTRFAVNLNRAKYQNFHKNFQDPRKAFVAVNFNQIIVFECMVFIRIELTIIIKIYIFKYLENYFM